MLVFVVLLVLQGVVLLTQEFQGGFSLCLSQHGFFQLGLNGLPFEAERLSGFQDGGLVPVFELVENLVDALILVFEVSVNKVYQVVEELALEV